LTIKDSFGRPVENLRVSVTQRCDFRCIYCHREGQEPNYKIEMSAEEIERIVRLAASLGVYSVKLTGGEPLLHSDIIDITRRISGIPGVKDVSMTTNGFLLARYADQLKEAGLSRVNVSLDTLKPERFRFITGVNAHKDVVNGIIKAVEVGLNPVKVNVVLLKDVNDDEVSDLMDFAGRHKIVLQIIELEKFGNEIFYERYHMDLSSLEKDLEEKASKIIVRRMQHRRKYILDNGVEVEIVKPMHNTEFCLHCNRIRLTSDGRLKPCLFRNNNLVDLLGPMRQGKDDEYLKNLFIEAVMRRKPFFI
jgi:cyclic pyranopterin phosphate synthase